MELKALKWGFNCLNKFLIMFYECRLHIESVKKLSRRRGGRSPSAMYLVLSVTSDSFVHEREKEKEDMSLSGKLGPRGKKTEGKIIENYGLSSDDLGFIFSNI